MNAKPEEQPGQNTTLAGLSRGQTSPGPGRIVALTDGVVAIAITLLILSFDVPDAASSGELARQLRLMLPLLEMYVASFLLIGYFWNIHHTIFELVERHDTTLRWFNLLWLLPLTALPFTTELIGENQDAPIAVALYYTALTLVSLFQALLWQHARGSSYTATLSPANAWHLRFRVITPMVVFGLGLFLSWISPQIARRVYLLVFVSPLARFALAPSESNSKK